jgi:ADP-heptose:LPS heptosyltransferase
VKDFLKKLERANKRFWYKTVFRLLFRNTPAMLPLDLKNVKRLLVIRRDMVGDMVITSSLFRRLKEKNPSLVIDVFCSPKGKSVLANNPRIERIFAANGFTEILFQIQEARRNRYDAMMCLSYSRSTQDGLIANLIDARAVKACFYEEKNADLYPQLFNAQLAARERGQQPLYESLHRFTTLFFGMDYDEKAIQQELFPTDADKESAEDFLYPLRESPFIVFNISARAAYRQWGRENNRTFLEKFIAAYPKMPIVISSSPDERAEAAWLKAELQSPSIYLLSENFSLFALSEVLAKAALLVSPDTALVHIAATHGVRSVILCTPLSSGVEWTPLHVPHINIYTAGRESIRSISPDDVMRGVDDLLGK